MTNAWNPIELTRQRRPGVMEVVWSCGKNEAEVVKKNHVQSGNQNV